MERRYSYALEDLASAELMLESDPKIAGSLLRQVLDALPLTSSAKQHLRGCIKCGKLSDCIKFLQTTLKDLT